MAKNKRWMLLSILLAALLLITAFWDRTGNDADNNQSQNMYEESSDMIPTPQPDVPQSEQMVFYQDADGYLIPMGVNIPIQDGIAKATLSQMVSSYDNDLAAAKLGLLNTIPEGTTLDLDIADGTARVDLGKNALLCADAVAESNMITAIVQTLSAFDTVDYVNFLIDGRYTETLTHGTQVGGDFAAGPINIESAALEASASGAEGSRMTLYFPADNGRVLVPVSRMVYGNNDITTALIELAKGPKEESGLQSVLPEGCGLIGVTTENGIAKINLSGEFVKIVQNSDGGRHAIKSLMLTCRQFPGVNDVQIFVDGKQYDTKNIVETAPTFANESYEVAVFYPDISDLGWE